MAAVPERDQGRVAGGAIPRWDQGGGDAAGQRSRDAERRAAFMTSIAHPVQPEVPKVTYVVGGLVQ
jgi:hypothetical protein